MEIAVLRICFFPEKVVRCQAIFPKNFFERVNEMIRVLVTDGMDKQAIEQLKQQGFQVSEQHYSCEDLGAAMA